MLGLDRFGGHIWTAESRARYDRGHLRCANDLTDTEYTEVGQLIPPAKRGGNNRTPGVREVVNGVISAISAGCQWRAIPQDLLPKTALYNYPEHWSASTTCCM